MRRAGDIVDTRGFAARRAADADKGLLRGLGICYYIESILGDPSETSKVVFNDSGTVNIYVGPQSTGQGHESHFCPVFCRSEAAFRPIRFLLSKATVI